MDSREKEFDVEVTVILTKQMKLPTSDFMVEEWCDSERDEDGYVCRTGGVDYDTSHVDWVQEYRDRRYTINDMLTELKGYINAELLRHTERWSERKSRLQNMLIDIEGWKEDIEVYKED